MSSSTDLKNVRMMFEDRYNEEIAGAMIEFGNSMPGLSAYLGIALERFAPGELWARASLGEELLTPSGNVHGGALAAIMDHVTGAVIYPLIQTGSWAATTELKLNYIAPAQAGELRAYASVLALGNRSAVVRGELHQGETLICAAQGTLTIIAPRKPAQPVV